MSQPIGPLPTFESFLASRVEEATTSLNHKALAFLDDFVSGDAKDDTVEGGLAVAVEGSDTKLFYYGKLVAVSSNSKITIHKSSKDTKPVVDAIYKEAASTGVELSEA